ncbi:MAG: M23 family metallopeptidase [Spirochaetaceae bacterium]|jgi:hypothetical protein|nr:M23 family metallopeptidase [Spirochaetaceae bacterium]
MNEQENPSPDCLVPAKRRRIMLMVLCGLSLLLTGMDWPSSEGRLAGNFGMNINGTPLLGELFSAEGDVYSADPGEVLFYAPAGDTGNFVSPLGNWMAIDHGDSVISVYARLGTISPSPPARLDKGITLGEAGRSGWVERDGFYFTFFDRRERQWVNPAKILNSLPDTIPPVIHSIKLKNTSGQIFDLAQTRNLRQGRYTLLVHATDRSEFAETAIAPFRIFCLLNGVEAGRIELETLSARDGVLLTYRNGLVPVRDIYVNAPAIEVAGDVSFTRGQASIEVNAQDFTGNTRNVSYRIFVE